MKTTPLLERLFAKVEIDPGSGCWVWMASTGPMSGPAPEMAAKWWPNSTRRSVGM